MRYRLTPEQLCLLDLARAVWKRRGQAKSIGMPFGEETVTETFLLDLATDFPGEVTVVPFGKTVEGRNGADWAWSFESADRRYSYPMLVQAKLLDARDRDYTEIARLSGKSGERQIDRLLAAAGRLGFPAYYAFYNHLDDISRLPSNCLSLGGASPMALPAAWGISIARAEDVVAALNDLSFDTHRSHSIALHCLLCSRGTGMKDEFGSPGAVGRRLALPEWEELDWAADGSGLPPGVRRGADPLFSQAREVASLGPESRSPLIERLREEYPGVDGVVIVRDAKVVPPPDR